MPYRLLLALAAFCSCGLSYAQDKPDAKKPSPLKTDKQKDSYAMGMDFGNFILQRQMEIDIEMLARGIRDVVEKKETLLTKEQQRAQIQAAQKRMFEKAQQRAAAEARKKHPEEIKKAEAYLEANKKRKGVKVTKSGLQYEILKPGKGASPKAEDRVQVHYRGTVIDGKEFDSSLKTGKPVTFGVGNVIPGWTEALQLMKEGGKWRVVIPPELAYKHQQRGPVITPFSTLIFEIELIKVNPPRE